MPPGRGVFDHGQDRAAAVGEHRVTWLGEQLPDSHPGVRCAGELTGIGRGESEQVPHLAPGDVNDAEALAFAQRHGPPFTAGHPQRIHHSPASS